MFLSLEQEAVFFNPQKLSLLWGDIRPLHVSQLSSSPGWLASGEGFALSLGSALDSYPPNLLHVQPEAMWCRNSCLFRQWSHFGLQQATTKFALNNATVEEFAWKQPPSKSGKKLCQEAIKKSSHRYIIMIKEQSYIGWKHGVARTCSEPLCSVMKIVAGKQKGSKYIHLFWQS